jgi:hypothetical protein
MTAVKTDRDLCQRPVLLNNWRYLRHDEAVRLADLSPQNRDRFGAALRNVDTTWRYPWPDEDMDAAMIAVEGILQRQLDRSFSLKVPDALRDIVAAQTHATIRHRVHGPREHGNLYADSPCPNGTQHRFRPSATVPIIEIVGRQATDLGEQTVFRCPFCDITFTLADENVPLVEAQLRRQQVAGWVGRWVSQVADRLVDHRAAMKVA